LAFETRATKGCPYGIVDGDRRYAKTKFHCHREERSDVAIRTKDRHVAALLAMTHPCGSFVTRAVGENGCGICRFSV